MTSQLPPLLSTVIPTHERPEDLHQLLASIADQEFSFSQLEILVVSNLPDDPSRNVIEKFSSLPIRWLCVGKKGVNFARNLGLREARADIALFLDDDCYLSHRYFFQEVLKAHVDHPMAVAIGGGYFPALNCSAVEEAYNVIALRWQERVTDRGARINLLGGNVSYKKSRLKALGLEFNDHIEFGGAETDFHLRIHQKGGLLLLCPDLNVEHRVHLTRLALLKKAFRQGMAAHVRWMKGLFEITRPGPTEIVPPAHVQKVVKQFQTSFNWGSQFAKDFEGRKATPLLLTIFFLRLFIVSSAVWSAQKFKQLLIFLRIGVAQKPILLDKPLNRFYVLPVSKDCAHQCAYAQKLGCRKVSTDSLASELKKAKTYGFSEVLLPCNAHQQVELDTTLGQIRDEGLKPVLLLNGDEKAAISDQEICGLEAKAPFHLLLGPPSPYQDHLLNLLRRSQPGLTATYFFEDVRSGLKKLRNIPMGLEQRTHVLFPASGPIWHYHPNCSEIYDFLNRASRKSQSRTPFVVRSASGFWPVERSEYSDRDVWPLLPCDQSSGKNSGRIRFSVIIPTFDSAGYLRKVLNALTRQDLPADQFEVIVLDDGSRDRTRDMIGEFITQEGPQFFFRYYFWPQVEGKKEFRAGLIRNFGVSQSHGEFLSFIDSDIILPMNYLSALARDFEDYDVIQAPREMLTAKASEATTTVREFHGGDIYPDEKYWETFKSFECWAKIRKFWKYTCTYALSVRREHFQNAGWFSPEFFSYGFEDVDLGYRLAKQGARFHLSHHPVFHLFPQRKDFNYHFDRKQRALVLTHSSRVFYRNRLDPEIYREFFPAYYQPFRGEIKHKAGIIQEKLRRASQTSLTADGEYREISMRVIAKLLFLPHVLRWEMYHWLLEGMGRLRHGIQILRWRIPYIYNLTRLRAKAFVIKAWWRTWPVISFMLKPYYMARFQYHKRIKGQVSHAES